MNAVLSAPAASMDTVSVDEAMAGFIRQRLGITLREFQMDSLRNAIAQACEQFAYTSPQDFLQALQNGASSELEYLTLQITVGESYFFRDHRQVEFLRDSWIPALVARKRAAGSKHIRIMSAGCSGGQEIYTLAILLNEALPDIDEWTLHLLGSDINTESLHQAQRGSYSAWSLRATQQHIRQKYFTHADGEYLIHNKLRNQVKFFNLNLFSDHYPTVATGTNALDLILCRNVFIYFDAPSIKQVLCKFSDCLEPDGLLILGASDIVDCQGTGLRLIQQNNMFWYVRDHGLPVAPIIAQNAPAKETPKPKPAPIPAAAAPPPAVLMNEDELLQKVLAAMQEERSHEAMELIEQHIDKYRHSSRLWRFKARLLANQGNLALAGEACQCSLSIDPTDKHSHFLDAIILSEQNRPLEAEKALRKSIFIDSYFIEAHHQLGMLLLSGGKRTQGVKSLRNALKICEKSASDQVLESNPELTLGRLSEILRMELSVYDDIK